MRNENREADDKFLQLTLGLHPFLQFYNSKQKRICSDVLLSATGNEVQACQEIADHHASTISTTQQSQTISSMAANNVEQIQQFNFKQIFTQLVQI